MKYMVDAENNILYSSVSTDKSSPFIWEEAGPGKRQQAM